MRGGFRRPRNLHKAGRETSGVLDCNLLDPVGRGEQVLESRDSVGVGEQKNPTRREHAFARRVVGQSFEQRPARLA